MYEIKRGHGEAIRWVLKEGRGGVVEEGVGASSDSYRKIYCFFICTLYFLLFQMKDCAVPCQSLLVSVGAKNAEKSSSDSYGDIYFYFAQRVILSEENPFYSFLSLMAEIGGYVGLLLGVSLFHFAGWLSALLEKQIRKYEVEATEAKEGM